MLKLVLDFEFDVPLPAVDRSRFANHGRVLQAAFLPDGRNAGTGALHFHQPGSAVRIARRPVWDRLTALAVEAWIFPQPNGRRRNIIEGDGSFALFVDSDDTLVASFFSQVDGASAPAWNLVSSSTHSPDGMPRLLPLNQWSKVVVYHDGITRTRLFIDDKLVAVRGDFRSGVSAIAATGVVVGNWPLGDQFAFAGSIDRVRVWKNDPFAATNDFSARPVDPEARDLWDDVWECLRAHLHQDAATRFAHLSREWEDLIRQLFRAVQSATEPSRGEFLKIIETYKENWRSNNIDSTANIDAIVSLRDWIRDELGASWFVKAEALAHIVLEIWADAACFDPLRIAGLDPKLANFFQAASARF